MKINFSALVSKKKPLITFSPGSVVKIGNRDYIILEHHRETTSVITKDIVEYLEFGKDDDYRKSNIRKYCEGKFYEELANEVGKENIIEHDVKLVADDGTGKNDTIKANVSILTTELYRKYRVFLPKYGRRWWTATRVSEDDSIGYSRCVCFVLPSGVLGWICCNQELGVRPFCVLSSEVMVKQ